MSADPQAAAGHRSWFYSNKRGLHDPIEHAGWCSDANGCEEVAAPEFPMTTEQVVRKWIRRVAHPGRNGAPDGLA